MALVPYKNSTNSLNRRRFSSCSLPVQNRIVCQQIFSIGSNTLVRSYSCDKVFHKDNSGRTFETTQVQFSSFLKKSSSPEEDIQTKRRNIVKTPLKKLHAQDCKNGGTNTEEKQTKTRLFRQMLVLTIATATVANLLYLYYKYKECALVWDLQKTHSELTENVFGQDAALTLIQRHLSHSNHDIDFNIMVFTGGVGVGKTLTSSIISRNFPWSTNLLLTDSNEYFSDLSKLQNIKLQTCGCNLIVVDDLTKETIYRAVNLLNIIKKLRKNNENIIVILIFRSPTEENTSEIISKLKLFKITHVPFQSLTQQNVEKCYTFEMKRQNVFIENNKIQELVKEKMKNIDVLKGSAGCKGVAEEVASFYKLNKNV